MSELRRAGDPKGFDKAHPKYDDSLLPKVTIEKQEADLAHLALEESENLF
jgi:hypothetical protein